MVQTVTINDAAKLKGVSRQAVHAAIKASKLETVIVEVPSTRVTRKSLNQWKPNPNMQNAGRRRSNGHATRRFCDERAGGCGSEITSTDIEAGYCTNCKREL